MTGSTSQLKQGSDISVCALAPGGHDLAWLNSGQVKNLLLFFDEIHLVGWAAAGDRLIAKRRALVDEFDDRDPADPRTQILRYQGPPFFEEDEGIRDNFLLSTELADLAAMGLVRGRWAEPAFAIPQPDRISNALTELAKIPVSEVPISNYVYLDQRLLIWPEDPVFRKTLPQLVEAGLAYTRRISPTGPVEFDLWVHPEALLGIRLAVDQVLRNLQVENNERVDPLWVGGIEQALSRPRLGVLESGRGAMGSAWDVVSTDLTGAGVDVSDVPLAEVLEFRERHHGSLREYSRAVRRFALLLSSAPEEERAQLARARSSEVIEATAAINDHLRRRWRLPLARFSLAGVGVGTTIAHEPIVGTAALLGAILGLKPEAAPKSAFHYLAAARRFVGRPGLH